MGDVLGKQYEVGEAVVRQGEPGDCMFVILEGEAEVIRREGQAESVVAVLTKGDIFGEMSVLKHQPRNATVRALTRLRVLTIDRKTFLRRIQEDPSIALTLLRHMIDRIEALDGEVVELQSELQSVMSKSQAAAPSDEDP